MNQDYKIEKELVEEAKRAGKHDSDEDAIQTALENYIRRCKRMEITELFGKIDYDPEYDYKAERLRDNE